MAKAKTISRKPTAKATSRQQPPAMPRSMHNRGAGDSRKAVQAPKVSKQAPKSASDEGLTRVTPETEVLGIEPRVERVVERAQRPSLPDVDRASSGRCRYVY